MDNECNHSQAKQGIDPNYLEKFPCAPKDNEARRSTLLCFTIFYFVFMAVVILVDLIVDHKIQLHLGLFISPLIYTFVLTWINIRKVRCYWVDYQNNIIADMGGEQEIIPFLEITGVEEVDRERSFELVSSFKVVRFLGTYTTRDNKPIKVFASSRSHFVLIKTKTIPNYIISPAEPKRFVEFMTGRLNGNV